MVRHYVPDCPPRNKILAAPLPIVCLQTIVVKILNWYYFIGALVKLYNKIAVTLQEQQQE